MLDFGTLRSQDRPKLLNLHLLNSGTKDVPITSVRTTPSNEAVAVDFKAVTLKAGESRYTRVASISFDASKARRPFQFSGKITVKAKEKSYSKLEIPYQAEVLDGYLGFDHTATLFHIRDSPVDPVERPIFLTNAFSFAVRIHNVSLPEEARTMFKVQNLSAPILIPPHESRYIFSLLFRPVRPSIHIDSNILLITNASKFHLPVRAYTGFLEPLVLPPSLKENILDFGVCSATDTSSVTFVVVNSNPIELEIKAWLLTGDSLSMELLRTERGNSSAALGRLRELQNSSASQQKTVILASGYYAAFRVTLVAAALEGAYDGAVHITTDYEILTIPVRALIAVGTLNSSPKHIVLPPSFPGKVVHQSFSIQSSFTQKVRLQQIRSLTEDVRFYYKRLRSNRDELEPRRRSKTTSRPELHPSPSLSFTPDFTSSRVIRELKLVTCGGSEFVFVLNASLPYHMLASCAETLPRPAWELELYVIVSLIMSSMFLLVIATAYLEAQSIWEPFKRRVALEASSSMETGRPFNLREIVQIHSESK
ncbi:Transmembrane protein 131 [Liparis tanakae]|uniref:Transmembrane protein 131 n=1 Tax=Liparis tanakae TaxID=230148 RepID=A0A4Z2EPF7_9TELE|nr:Transmembrane protein 131 [Liparis tanakae]